MSSNEEVLPEETTKQAFRQKVWNYLEKNDLATFPRPVHHRIPNFKGSGEAAQKLKELDAFLTSRVVKVNPDKPQEIARLLALEAGKTVLVPIPRLRNGLFHQIQLPAGATNKESKIAASRKGFELYGKPLGLDSKIKVDLVIIGSVAVSKEGHRIGKGEGYADLEFAMMVGMHAVDDDTPIVTIVHDCQVFESLPHQLFKEHDVPVDIILTPTQLLTVSPQLPRPVGIIWNILSERRLKEIPILQTLRDQQMAEGKDCTLKEIDSDVEEYQPRRDPQTKSSRNRERRNRNKQRNHLDDDSQGPRERINVGSQGPRERINVGSQGPRERINAVSLGPRKRINAGSQGSREKINAGSLGPREGISADFGGNNESSGNHVNNSAAENVKPAQRSRMFRRRKRRSSRRDSENGTVGPSPEPGVVSDGTSTAEYTKDETEGHVKERPRRRRVRRPAGDMAESQNTVTDNGKEEQDPERNKEQFRLRRAHRRNAFNFSLRVDNIGTDVRVRELKAALAERGVRPIDITWKGSKGFAMLHFRNPVEHENIIASLQDIKLREEGETLLVQLAQPTRVEVTDISSV